MSAKLSTRARNLSQRRQSRIRGEGHDLSHQDKPMDRDSWVPASEHTDDYDGEDMAHDQLEDEDHHHDGSNGENRGREEQRAVAA